MAITDFFVSENPEVVIIAIGVLMFVIIFSVFDKFRAFGDNGKGIRIFVSFIIAAIGMWYFYKEDFFGWEVSLGVVLTIVVVVIVLRIVWAFVKHTRRNF